MKKLMFTLTLVALSGSSILGVHAPVPVRRTQPRTSGTTAKLYMNPELSKCLENKGTSPTNMNMKNIKTKADYEACYMLHGPESSGEGTAGVTAYDDPNLQKCFEEKGQKNAQTLQQCKERVYGIADIDHYGERTSGTGVTTRP